MKLTQPITPEILKARAARSNCKQVIFIYAIALFMLVLIR